MLRMKSMSTLMRTRRPRPQRRWRPPDSFSNSLSSDAGTAPAHVEAASSLIRMSFGFSESETETNCFLAGIRRREVMNRWSAVVRGGGGYRVRTNS